MRKLGLTCSVEHSDSNFDRELIFAAMGANNAAMMYPLRVSLLKQQPGLLNHTLEFDIFIIDCNLFYNIVVGYASTISKLI